MSHTFVASSAIRKSFSADTFWPFAHRLQNMNYLHYFGVGKEHQISKYFDLKNYKVLSNPLLKRKAEKIDQRQSIIINLMQHALVHMSFICEAFFKAVRNSSF